MDYYIGYLDNKCTKVEGCMISENEDRCLLCDDIYCLNKKTGLCMDNQYIEDENYKFYYKCNITNDEGSLGSKYVDFWLEQIKIAPWKFKQKFGSFQRNTYIC